MTRARWAKGYKERQHRPRRCDICGRSYHRRNRYEGWIQQAPGSRLGWRKAELRVCTTCQPAYQTMRSMVAAEAAMVTPDGKQLASGKA